MDWREPTPLEIQEENEHQENRHKYLYDEITARQYVENRNAIFEKYRDYERPISFEPVYPRDF